MKYPPWPSVPWWKVLGKSWWFRKAPRVTADWHPHTNTQPARSSSAPTQWTSHLKLDMPQDFPAAEKNGVNKIELSNQILAKFVGKAETHLTSRTFAYCSFRSSTELETFLAVSFSRFSKELASDWRESRLTLRTKCKTFCHTSVTDPMRTN